MSTNKRWLCRLCGELMTEDQQDDLTYVADHGDRYQPAENASRCANARCSGTHEDQDEVWLCDEADCTSQVEEGTDHCIRHNLEAEGFFVCDGCNKEPVPDEGERCPECYTTELEARADAANEGEL